RSEPAMAAPKTPSGVARFGRNMKWTVEQKHRSKLRQLFCEVLRADVKSAGEDVDVFVFAGPAHIGVEFTEASRTLDESAYVRAPWLEFLVDNMSRVAAQLDALGVERHSYSDQEHPYFRAPGGPVFRLANG